MTAVPAKCPLCGRPDCVQVVATLVIRGYFAGMCMQAMRADPQWALRLAKIAALDGTR